MFRKIDIHFKGQYVCSTNSSKTCKEAKQKYLDRLNPSIEHGIKLSARSLDIKKNPELLKANFSK